MALGPGAGSRAVPALLASARRGVHALVEQTSESQFLRYGKGGVPVVKSHNEAAATPPTEVSTLSNGLRVATCSKPFAESATVGVWIDAGTRFEPAESNGAAHLLEHMVFKGTKNRSAAQLEEEVENMGAKMNAYTSRENTTFFTQLLRQDVRWGVELLADTLQNCVLDPNKLLREQQVILRESQEVEKDSGEMVLDHLHATAFQGSPLARSIIGSESSVRSLTADHVREYIKQQYQPHRMCLVGVGGVSHSELCSAGESLFSSLPTGGPSVADHIASNPSKFTGSDVRVRDDDMSKLHFSVAVEGPSLNDPDLLPCMVMQHMLGSWDRFYPGHVNIGPKLGQYISTNNLANKYHAFCHSYSDTGLFGVHAETDKPMDADDLAWAIMEEFSRLAYEVDEDDVTRAQEQLKASLASTADSSHAAYAEEIGRHMLAYGRHVPRSEMFARIDAISPEAVKAAAQRFVKDQEIVLAAIGPTQFLPDYNWFRRRTYKLRF